MKAIVSESSVLKTLLSASALSIASFFVATAAHAQEADAQAANAPTQDAASDRSSGIADIVVTARKTAENLQSTPLAITAFTGADLVTRQIRGIADLGRSTPSLRFDQPSYDTFSAFVSLRGVTATDILLVSEPAVGIYVDGVYQGTTQGTGLNDSYDIDRIEVLKGPQGTLYGRNSTGGAVSVYTNLPDYDGWSGSVRLGLGNYDTQQGAAAINIPIAEDKAALRIVGQYYDRGDGTGFDVTNQKEKGRRHTQSYRATLRLDPADGFQIILRGDYSRGTDSGKITKLVGAQDPLPFAVALSAGFQYGLITGPGDLITNPALFATIRNRILSSIPAEDYRISLSPTTDLSNRVRAYGGSGTISYEFSDAATLKSITAYRYLKKFNGSDPDGFALKLVDTVSAGVLSEQFTQEIQLTGELFGSRLKYAVGGYYFHGFGDDFAFVNALDPINPTNPSETLAHVDDKSYAGYAQGTFSVVDGLNITGGVRYTDETKILTSRNRNTNGTVCQVPVENITTPGICAGDFPSSFTNWSYTGSIDYQVTPTTLLYARTSKGFKAGGQNERGSSIAGTYAPFGPETLTDYEIVSRPTCSIGACASMPQFTPRNMTASSRRW